MKRWGIILLCVLLMGTFVLFAMGSSSDESGDGDQGTGKVDVDSSADDNTTLGDYTVEIASCRLAKNYDKKPVVIVKYVFTNNSDEAQAFYLAFNEKVYQDGVGLNEAYVLEESAKYSADNQTKSIKPGATLDVEVAYILNDTETDIEVEVEELFSFNSKIISKKFTIK